MVVTVFLWASAALASLAFVLATYLKHVHANADLAFILKRYFGKMVMKVRPISIPRIVKGAGSTAQVGEIVKELGCRKLLVVGDVTLVSLGVVSKCTDALEASGLQFAVFDNVVPDPLSESVEEGWRLYSKEGCDGIIAIGGGSPMDAAKAIGARVAHPNKHVLELAGEGAMRTSAYPPLVAVPTTAGSGSEGTIVAVVTDSKTDKKVFLLDKALVPPVVVLDPELLVTLTKADTRAAGMDALTHGIESYISGWATPLTKELSISAVSSIVNNLVTTYNNGSALDAREMMLHASFNAGVAATRTSIGYVHAIANQLGGMFHVPHGDANAMLLPHVLTFHIQMDTTCCERLCELAKASGLVSDYDRSKGSFQRVAITLVERIAEMNEQMSMPSVVDKMKPSDVKIVAERAFRDAHGTGESGLAYIFDVGYPVPSYMTMADCEAIIRRLLPAT